MEEENMDPNFAYDDVEDWFAWEEMALGERSKCRRRGAKKRDKFKIPGADTDNKQE